MRVLVLCYEHPPVGGGGGRIAARLAQALVARGHEVRYLTGNVDPPHRLPERSVEGGVEVIRVGSPRKLPDTCSVPEMAGFVLAACLAGWREVRAFRPHILHVHFAVPSGGPAWVLSCLTGTPYLLTAHLGDVPGGVPEQTAHLFRWVKPFTVPIWRRAAALTAVSQFVADLAQAAYGVEPHVIPNGLDFIRTPRPVAKGPPRFLFVGRMSVQKNPLLALRALETVRDLEWELEMVGDGPLRAEAEAFVKVRDWRERVRFRGWLEAAELAQVRRGAAVLLMPSLAEGLPMAAVEALVDGLAIVGTRIPGLADVVTHGENGLLTDPTPEAFGEAVRRILTDADFREKCQQRSWEKAEDFQLAGIVDRYEKLLTRHARQEGRT